jgi:hypothetical protein
MKPSHRIGLVDSCACDMNRLTAHVRMLSSANARYTRILHVLSPTSWPWLLTSPTLNFGLIDLHDHESELLEVAFAHHEAIFMLNISSQAHPRQAQGVGGVATLDSGGEALRTLHRSPSHT